MSVARILPDATPLADGRILVTGGFTNDDGQTSVASAELFDPSANSWSSAGQMSIGHTLGIAKRLQDGRVLVAGGADANLNPTWLASADIDDPITSTCPGSRTRSRCTHPCALRHGDGGRGRDTRDGQHRSSRLELGSSGVSRVDQPSRPRHDASPPL